MIDQHRQTYKEETRELLVKLEADLLELEENPNDSELIASVFRALHTIKGSGAMFGFDDIAAFTHEAETVFDCIREGRLGVNKTIVDLALSACDLIRQMVDGDAIDSAAYGKVRNSFQEMIPIGDFAGDASNTSAKKEACADTGRAITYHIRFQPCADIFTTGTNPVFLLDELRGLGPCKVVAHTGSIPRLDEMNPESCYIYWDVILTTDQGINSIKDVFIFVEDDSRITIDPIDEDGLIEEDNDYKKLGEILVERGDVSAEEITKILQSKKRIGELLVERKAVNSDAVASALVEQEYVRQVRKTRQEKAETSSIRVPAERLDALADLVGELVTVQARLTQKSELQDDPELVAIAEEVERLTTELRDNTMGIRTLPISTIFARFRRLVRDLSKELGKEIILETEGGETELDKTVIDRLNDPLVHLIRNSIDHGIESPAKRRSAGKSAHGTIRLSAAHRGANVYITIEDDGAGLDVEAIRAKAVKKGMISPDANMTDDEIFAFMFIPGFSTAQKVTDISGRGVGMDVVKRSIDALRGNIVISSTKGVGTTITMKLPLTLAIIDGLLVELDKAFYVMPLSVVEECVELTSADIAKTHGRSILNVRGKIVPYIPLRGIFGIKNEAPDIEHIVIAEVDGRRFGIVVDKIIGGHQTVIKTLGTVYGNVKGFSGATILADGTVALILDIQKLNEIAEAEELGRHGQKLH